MAGLKKPPIKREIFVVPTPLCKCRLPVPSLYSGETWCKICCLQITDGRGEPT